MLYQEIFISLIFGMIHYFKNWVKGHDNILKITVTYISENLFVMRIDMVMTYFYQKGGILP